MLGSITRPKEQQQAQHSDMEAGFQQHDKEQGNKVNDESSYSCLTLLYEEGRKTERSTQTVGKWQRMKQEMK